jgi:hypothetical protein
MSRLLTSKRQPHTAKPVTGVMVNFLHVLKSLFIYNSTLLLISKLTHKIQEIQSTSGYVRFKTIFWLPGECINPISKCYFISLFIFGKMKLEQSVGSCHDSSACTLYKG